ncbi:hypothetical protein DCAR_0414873 [Daucus carota subsp. sativus]|uniref:Uncharacterized protein n=1 Tax=Daucus carota subsp. sativus TaxID=79200 RepID=A0AAF1AUL4_DAUCS|nr:hypothetical protein DCAR_0414873 [Daucus carota subsp. sativus]
MIMIGMAEANIVVDQLTSIQIDDDFEGLDDFFDIKDRSVNKQNLQRFRHQCRTSKKLLVLGIDGTIIDHRMKWIQLKLEEFWVLDNPDYKITTIFNRYAMISIRDIILEKYLFYKPSNTIVIYDLLRNFVMNPQNGLMTRHFRKAHARQADQEL